MILLRFLTAALFVAVNTAASQQPVGPPADFAFRFESKPCATTTFDTYTNTYTRVASNEPSIPIPLTLLPKQMAVVYEEIVKIGFFSYQADFRRVVPGPGGETTTTIPSTTYRLEVRSGGMIYTVTYDDKFSSPRSEEADGLLNLFKLIDGFVNDLPDVKRLPALRFHCE